MNRLTYYLNKRLKKSYWYKNILFKDCEKFWHIQDEVYDIVNLGSNSGVYDFDYTNISLKCANWAFGPQTINGDWAILRQFKKNLDRKSVV